MKINESDTARAFGAGCDARIQGAAAQLNPHKWLNGDAEMHKAWDLGWLHADQYWGSEDRHARRLPSIREHRDVI